MTESSYGELEIRDKDNQRSIVNLLPTWIASYILAIPEEIFSTPLSKLIERFEHTETDSLLRHAFWLEYERAMKTDTKMTISNIFGGVCDKNYFNREVVTNSFRMAYLLNPPTDYNVRLEELLTIGLEQYREILTLPNINAKGAVDSRLIAVKQKIIEDVTNRRRGQVIQRVEVKSQNLNVNVDKSDKKTPDSIEAIEREIQELEQARPPALPEVVRYELPVQEEEVELVAEEIRS